MKPFGRRRAAWCLCIIAASAVGISGQSMLHPAAAISAVSGWNEVDAPLLVNDVVNDPSRDHLLVSLRATMPGFGNSVAEIDPSTGAIIRQVAVGTDPGPVALSGDGKVLYVGLNGSDRVVRVDMVAFTVVSSFQSGLANAPGPLFAKDIEVVPGDPNAVAVAWRTGLIPDAAQTFAGLAVYDNGAIRTKVAGSSLSVDSIVFDGSPGRMYGYNAQTNTHEFSTWQVDPTGLSLLNATPGLITGNSTTLKFRGGRIQTSYGAVIDPLQRIVVGSFTSTAEQGDVVTSANRAYFVHNGTIDEYRADNYFNVAAGSLSASGTATALIGTSRGIAIANSAGALMLFGSQIGPAATVTSSTISEHLSTLSPLSVQLQTNAILTDAVRHTLLPTVPAVSPSHGDELVEIDTNTGAIGRHVTIGNDPAAFAISDEDATGLDASRCGGVTGIWLIALAGFGLSLEQPTVMEQATNNAAIAPAQILFPQVTELGDSAIFLTTSKRFMVTTSCC